MAHLPDLEKYPETFGHQLPEYFSIAEFEYSEEAIKKGIDNTITDAEHYENARQFMLQVLDPLRYAWTQHCVKNDIIGSYAITISSGYRTEEVNKLVGGSKTSAHLYGYAVDMSPRNKKMNEFQEWLPTYLKKKKIMFDQLIFEKPKNGIASWIHLGWKNKDGLQRKQMFTLV